MITRFKERGFRTVVIEEPYLTTKSRNYPEALSSGYLARHYDGSPYTFDFWPGECGLIDFSNPAVLRWWSEKHRSLLECGIDGFWADLNEPAKHFQDMAHLGGPAAAVHNTTALSMQEAIYDSHQRYAPQRRPFILSRSAFPGSQRYGAGLWSGDVDMTFASLRKQVALGLNVGLAGIPLWGSDIGGFGFGGKCTAELYARWFQFGTFCPLVPAAWRPDPVTRAVAVRDRDRSDLPQVPSTALSPPAVHLLSRPRCLHDGNPNHAPPGAGLSLRFTRAQSR